MKSVIDSELVSKLHKWSVVLIFFKGTKFSIQHYVDLEYKLASGALGHALEDCDNLFNEGWLLHGNSVLDQS